MLPWFFSTGHHLYARWLTVHALDLLSLETNAPEVHRRFSMGSFVVRKTLNPFSALGIDHAHEQNNASIKSAGGALGLTQDSAALRRWTVAGPEVMRLLSEFEGKQDQQKDNKHHEQYPKFQLQFFENCAALKEGFLQSENPFSINNPELMALDTRIEIGEKGREALNTLENRGVKLLTDFIVTRFETYETPFYNPVKKECVQIFTHKKKAKTSLVTELKYDLHLFSRLFIVSLARSLDLEQFFNHENQECPPALSEFGNLRTGVKAKLVPILENLAADAPFPGACDGIILDGAAIVRIVKPREGTTSFQEFGDQVTNYCTNMASKMGCNRIDIVWDQYNEKSLKATARESRGTGARRPGLPQKAGTFPKRHKQWEEYLKNDGNKAELFGFLAEIALTTKNMQIVTNVKDIIRSNLLSQSSALDGISCAGMEEADGRLFLHAQDMVQHGAKCVLIRCSDTDIVVLAISFYHYLHRLGLKELWVQYSVGTSKRFISAHCIAEKLGDDRACALRGFHAFTGCDSVSFFNGKGKPSAWTAWDPEDEQMTRAFKILGMPSKNPPDHILPVLERFVVALYKAEPCESVGEARQHLFTAEGKPLLFTPCTLGALKQHTRRACYQGGQIWGSSLQKCWDDVPSPAGWGWKMENGQWVPHWTSEPNIWQACRDLSVCGCTTGCSTKRCSCRKAGIPCTLACKKCKGSCDNKKTESNAPEPDEDVDGDLLPS